MSTGHKKPNALEKNQSNIHRSKKNLAEFEGNVNHLEDKKRNIWNRISTFCEKITDLITAITNIPNNITNVILLFSNHKQIQQISISIFHKLRQFSFMMKDPCNINEIQEYEVKCKQILNTDSYELPDLFRITMLLYNAIQIPPIFKHSWNGSHSFGVLLESFIKPLNKWIHISSNSYKGYYSDIIDDIQGDYDQESNNKIQSWFDTNGIHHYYIFLIGYYFNGDTFPVRVYFNIKTKEMFVYETEDYWDGYVDFMSVKQMFNYSVAQVDKEKLFEEYDLCDLCNCRKIYGCHENYDPGYAEHLFLIECVAEPGFLDNSNEDFQTVVSLIYENNKTTDL
eukprot:509409_1